MEPSLTANLSVTTSESPSIVNLLFSLVCGGCERGYLSYFAPVQAIGLPRMIAAAGRVDLALGGLVSYIRPDVTPFVPAWQYILSGFQLLHVLAPSQKTAR